MKKTMLIAYLFMLINAHGQKTILTIDSCYSLARKNYPLIKQVALTEKAKDYNISNASKGYLPQINFSGQATYQSEVTKIPVSIPGVAINELSKDQYRIYGEMSQSLTDPLLIKQQKQLIKSNAFSEQQKLEAEMFKVKERINQIYFGILLIDAQIEHTGILKRDISSALDKINSAIENGVAFRGNADILEAELLKSEQRIIELKANRKGFLNMLSAFINQPLNESTVLSEPPVNIISNTINRPELKLFDLQKTTFGIQNKLLVTKNIPRISLFFQAGYGRPTLNMLSNDFGTYYIGGARFSWNVSGLYSYYKEKQLQLINSSTTDVQKEVFLFNTRLSLEQQHSEINKFAELIASDEKILSVRQKIKSTAVVQLENGVITPLDFISYVNAEDQAKQNLIIHKIQLLMTQYNYQATSGN